MCTQKAVAFDKLTETNLKTIRDAYKGIALDRIRFLTQYDGSIWMLSPSSVSSTRQRGVMPLAQCRTHMLYKIEVPVAFLQAAEV